FAAVKVSVRPRYGRKTTQPKADCSTLQKAIRDTRSVSGRAGPVEPLRVGDAGGRRGAYQAEGGVDVAVGGVVAQRAVGDERGPPVVAREPLLELVRSVPPEVGDVLAAQPRPLLAEHKRPGSVPRRGERAERELAEHRHGRRR